jgi:hypothetical protein
MELYFDSPQDQQPPPGLDQDADNALDLFAQAQNVGNQWRLPRLADQVAVVFGDGTARSRIRSCRAALADLLDIDPAPNPGSDRHYLETALQAAMSDLTRAGVYFHWTDYTEGLEYEGKKFAHYCPPYGALAVILNYMDNLPAGRGYAHGDRMKDQRTALHIDAKKLAARTREKGTRHVSQHALESWRPYTERNLGLIIGESKANNRREHRPAWWGMSESDARDLFAKALRTLVEDDRAGRLPKRGGGSLHPKVGATEQAPQAHQAPREATLDQPPMPSHQEAPPRADRPRGADAPWRNCGGTVAELKLTQPNVETGCCDDFRADTDTDYIRSAFREGSTTKVSNTTSGGLVRGSGSNRSRSGSRLPPDASLPAYVGALVSVLGEGRRSTVETAARVMIAAYGDEAVAPFFEEAARVKWTGVLEAVTWIKAQVSAAVARGDIPEAEILAPITPAAAALKNRARG